MDPEQKMKPAPNLAEAMAGLARLQATADLAFKQVTEQFPGEVACSDGCDDCCYAVFDLTPVEAAALALAFRTLPRQVRREARRRADKAAATFDQLTSEALALPLEERIDAFSRARVRCPLLKDKKCLLYAQRPLTCRLYGIPVATEGKSHSCHRSRFSEGTSYPTVDYGKVQAELGGLSETALKLLPTLPPQRQDVARVLIWAQDQALTLEPSGA